MCTHSSNAWMGSSDCIRDNLTQTCEGRRSEQKSQLRLRRPSRFWASYVLLGAAGNRDVSRTHNLPCTRLVQSASLSRCGKASWGLAESIHHPPGWVGDWHGGARLMPPGTAINLTTPFSVVPMLHASSRLGMTQPVGEKTRTAPPLVQHMIYNPAPLPSARDASLLSLLATQVI